MLDTPFSNRLRKSYRHLKKWARRTGVQAYRVYDHDIPDQPIAIDLYQRFVHAQEYERARAAGTAGSARPNDADVVGGGSRPASSAS